MKLSSIADPPPVRLQRQSTLTPFLRRDLASRAPRPSGPCVGPSASDCLRKSIWSDWEFFCASACDLAMAAKAWTATVCSFESSFSLSLKAESRGADVRYDKPRLKGDGSWQS